jgi:hypothetical protein
VRDLTPRNTKQRFQETFSQYASRIWSLSRFKNPHCWSNWSHGPEPSADPNRNPIAGTPLRSTNRRIRNRAARQRRRHGQQQLEEIWDLLPVLGRNQRLGCGFTRGGGRIKIEPCRRKSQGVAPWGDLSRSSFFGPCIVWFPASTWSISFFFIFFPQSPASK